LASLDETFKNHKNASFIFFGDSHKHKNLKSLGRKNFSLSFFRKALPMMLSSQARMYLTPERPIKRRLTFDALFFPFS
jgi:hypothetical protein